MQQNTSKYSRPEIERKYLLKNLPIGFPFQETKEIEDFYLTDTRLRLRKVFHTDTQTFTYKLTQIISTESPEAKQITTIYLSDFEYKKMFDLFKNNSRCISKTRYLTKFENHVIGFDRFISPMFDFVIAEVCVNIQEAFNFITIPADWVDITDNSDYFGYHLAQYKI